MDLTNVNLARLRTSEADTLSRWLCDDAAMLQLTSAIEKHLGRVRDMTPSRAEDVYTFGREMRQLYENRANAALQFHPRGDRVDDRVFVVFWVGFLRFPFEHAVQLSTAPGKDLARILQTLIPSRAEGAPNNQMGPLHQAEQAH